MKNIVNNTFKFFFLISGKRDMSVVEFKIGVYHLKEHYWEDEPGVEHH